MIPEIKLFNFEKVEDINEVVSSYKITNDVKTPVGTCTLTLDPVMGLNGGIGNYSHEGIISDWEKKIKLNSVISIKTGERHVFLGLVDHRYRSEISNNSSTGRTLNINCSMLLPKMLMRDNIVNSPVLSTHEKIKNALKERTEFWGWMRGMTKDGKTPFAGYPEEAVKWILENAPATTAEYDKGFKPKDFISGGKSKTDIDGKPFLDFRFLDGEFLFDVNLSIFSGTIYNYITSCIDEDFYEVFFDTTTGDKGLAYNRMIIRPKPFGSANYEYKNDVFTNWMNFEELEAIECPREEIMRMDLGVNDFELKNMFTVNFVNSLIGNASSGLGKFGVQFPTVNLKSIKKFGVRELQLKSSIINMVNIAENYNKKVEEAIKNKTELPTLDKITEAEEYKNNKSMLDYLLDKRDKAVEWYGFPYFKSGQITVIEDEKYRHGKCLYLPDDIYVDEETGDEYKGVYYYIKSVQRQFHYGQMPTASMNLIRGVPKGFVGKWLNEHRHDFVSIDKRDYMPVELPPKNPDVDYEEIKTMTGKMTTYEEI
jgi:hypothetical protein